MIYLYFEENAGPPTDEGQNIPLVFGPYQSITCFYGCNLECTRPDETTDQLYLNEGGLFYYRQHWHNVYEIRSEAPPDCSETYPSEALTEPNTVVIEIDAGHASVAAKPGGVKVRIVNYDQKEVGEEHYIDDVGPEAI